MGGGVAVTAAAGPEVERLLRRRMPADLRVRVALEIVATYLQVRRRMLRGDVRDVVERLRDGAVDAHDPYVAYRIGRRLGQPVRRTLDPLPWDSRCLMRSLVLLRMLARRGVVCQLVIGVRPGETLEAHAWIEHDKHPLLPTLGYERLTVL
jgi:transglutaminase superfamily protein